MLVVTVRKQHVAFALEMRVTELLENGVACRLEGGVGSLRWSAEIPLDKLVRTPSVGEVVIVKVSDG